MRYGHPRFQDDPQEVHGTKWRLNVVWEQFAVAVLSLREAAQRSHDFESVLAANATDVTIRDNHVTQNDHQLTLSSSGTPSCPGILARISG
jgi:hypothetical protein